MVPGVLMNSLSENYGSPGWLAEFKRQLSRAFRRPDDDPSIFAIELETLARMAFADIDSSVQLQMVRDWFIDGQADCALRRHLNSFGPDSPMRDIVDSCRVWESHNKAAVHHQDDSDRNSPWAVYQVTRDIQSTAVATLDEVIRRLLPTPSVPPPKAAPISSDQELLIQRLLGVIRPSQLVLQERSKLTDMEIVLQNLLLVSSVVEEDGPSSERISESPGGVFFLWRDGP